MESNTRLVRNISKFIAIIQNKFYYTKNNFPIKLFFLFMGFLVGSLFGTFLPNFPQKMNSHSVSIVVIILIIEVINFLVYSSAETSYLLGSLLAAPLWLLTLIKVKIILVFINVKKEKRIVTNSKKSTKIVIPHIRKDFYININSMKIGILLGLFIDAFKVGS